MAATIKRIHVNQYNIKANAKAGENDPILPVFTVKNRGKTIVGFKVDVEGPSQLVYKPNDPLSCGAKCWIETTSPVIMDVGTNLEFRIGD